MPKKAPITPVLEDSLLSLLSEKSKFVGSNISFLRRNYELIESILSMGGGFKDLNNFLKEHGLGYDNLPSLRLTVSKIRKEKASEKNNIELLNQSSKILSFDEIHIRLKQERERLMLTQEAFGEHAQAKKRTVADWESGKSSPTAVQLNLLSLIGVDVQFVVSGVRSVDISSTLTDAEEQIIETFRNSNTEGRNAILAVVSLASKLDKESR